MKTYDLKIRTKTFSIEVLKFVQELPRKGLFWSIKDQIIRSASSVGANYRAAKRVKSEKDFIYKLKVVEEELDETCYWLEIILELWPESQASTQKLLKESDELLAIIVSSIKKAKNNNG